MFICLLLIHSLGEVCVNIRVLVCKHVLCEFVSEVSLGYCSLSEIGSFPGKWISLSWLGWLASEPQDFSRLPLQCQDFQCTLGTYLFIWVLTSPSLYGTHCKWIAHSCVLRTRAGALTFETCFPYSFAKQPFDHTLPVPKLLHVLFQQLSAPLASESDDEFGKWHLSKEVSYMFLLAAENTTVNNVGNLAGLSLLLSGEVLKPCD